jgi:hypothetical protein
MAELSPEVEQHLASMSDGEFAALTAKVRAPDSTEQLRTFASKVLSPQQLESFMAFADVSKFADANGSVTEESVVGRLTGMFGGAGGQQFGRRGEAGKAAAARRFNLETDEAINSPPPPSLSRPGEKGRAAAQRRFNKTQEGTQ